MNKRHFKIGAAVLALYLLLACMFYLIAREQLTYRDEKSDMLSASTSVGEITVGVQIRQKLEPAGDWITAVGFRVATYGRVNTCSLSVRLEDADGTVLAVKEISCESFTDGETVEVTLDTPLTIEAGEPMYLVISSPDGVSGNAVTLYIGDSVSAGNGSAELLAQDELATCNGETLPGILCCQLTQRSSLLVASAYWYVVAALGAALMLYFLYVARLAERGKTNPLLEAYTTLRRYSFLMKQLILRDFKSRYKRSVLGVLWSFLNPLLTMLVQYVVFSTIFRSDIPNYALYLLTGVVCFNFFNEATSVASASIVTSAPLIKKVYVPKLVYPLAAVTSSSINLALSIIPLVAVMFLTGAYPRSAMLLLPYGLLCLIGFSLGIGLVLATGMVFFKDIQFLWNIITMLWMYATPLFYPESIIPESILGIYHCNPLYQIVTFCRTVLINGVSPTPSSYLYCGLSAVIAMAAGLWIFRKKQDEFILNL